MDVVPVPPPDDTSLDRTTLLACWFTVFLVSAGQYYLSLNVLPRVLLWLLPTVDGYLVVWLIIPLIMLLLPAMIQWMILRVRLKPAKLPVSWWLLGTVSTSVVAWILFCFLALASVQEAVNISSVAAFVIGVVQWVWMGTLIGTAQAYVLKACTKITGRFWVVLSATGWTTGFMVAWLLLQ